MVNSFEVRKVTQDVLLFVWFKQGALSEEPPRESGLIPVIPDELMNTLSASVFVESFRTQVIWDDFFKKHFKRMTSSSQLFANYVAYACYVLNESTNVHESFFDILSIVSEFSLRCLEGDCVKYLNTSVDLFCAFFQKELCTNFEYHGGWKKFNEYIRQTYNSTQSKFMISGNESLVGLFEYYLEALERGNQPDYLSSKIDFNKNNQPSYLVHGVALKDITQIQVETHEKAVDFAKSLEYKLENLISKTFDELIIDFEKTYRQVKNLYSWANQSNGIKRKVEERNQYKPRQEKWQLEKSFLKKVQQSSVGMNNTKLKQSPVQMKNEGLFQKLDKDSGVMKRQSEQGSYLKISQSLDGMKSKELEPKLAQESFYGMKKQEQCSSVKVLEHLGGTKKGSQRKTKRQTSGVIKRQGEQWSSRKIRKAPGKIRTKGVQRQVKQELSDEMRSQGERCSLPKIHYPPDGTKIKEVQDRVSSEGKKNQRKHFSLNVAEVSEIVSCLLRLSLSKKKFESKPVAARDPSVTRS